MKVTVKKIDGAKISFIFALSFALLTLFLFPLMFIPFILDDNFPKPMLLFPIIAPFFYFIFTYIFSRIFFGVFGLVLTKYKGFEIEVEDIQKDENN
jgi:hypothetical protein